MSGVRGERKRGKRRNGRSRKGNERRTLTCLLRDPDDEGYEVKDDDSTAVVGNHADDLTVDGKKMKQPR